VLEPLVIIVALGILIEHMRRLPLQNVLVIGLILLAVAGMIQLAGGWWWGWTFSLTPLFIWLGLILVSRECAKAALSPLKGGGNYGLWLIFLASILTTVAWTGFDWLMASRFSVPDWRVFLFRWLISVGLLVVIAPWMIQKKPVANP
jgi:hypothetical protein